MVLKGVNFSVWAMVLKWVNLHQFPKFLFWMVLKGVKCCHIWRVLKWVNVHQFTSFSWMVLKGVSLCCYTVCCLDFGCPIHVVQWCNTAVLAAFLPLPWLHRGHSHGLHHELSSSVLNGDLSSVHGGLPGLLSCWGLMGLSVHQLLGSVLLGLDLSSCAGLVCGESFSPSMADFLSEMKLKASSSAMSQFAVLALIQLSKVLKEIDLFAFLALTHSWKVLKSIELLLVSSMVLKETLLVTLLSMVLKEGALLTSCSMSWKETFFLPDLPMVLKEVSLPLFLTMSLTLLALSFSLMTLMPSTPRGFKGVDLCLSCSLLPCVLAGVLKGVSVHVAMVLKEVMGYTFCNNSANNRSTGQKFWNNVGTYSGHFWCEFQQATTSIVEVTTLFVCFWHSAKFAHRQPQWTCWSTIDLVSLYRIKTESLDYVPLPSKIVINTLGKKYLE